MTKITVDTRGKLCPLPLIMLKKKVDTSAAGTEIEVLTDNATSCSNLEDYIHELGSNIARREQEGYVLLSFSIPTDFSPRPINKQSATERWEHVSESLPYDQGADAYVIAIASDRMGSGEDELGRVLLRAFVNAIAELDALPSHIVMYNSGVFCALKGSDTANTLETLERELGVKVIVCGTCVDYYDLKDKLQVGSISNMYSIMQILTAAHHIVRP